MEIKRFNEAMDSGDYDYEWGGYCFVLAKPKKGWEHFDCHAFKNEFVPCMIIGHGDGQGIYLIGKVYSYNLSDFEIIKDSDKGFMEMLELYTTANKYNL